MQIDQIFASMARHLYSASRAEQEVDPPFERAPGSRVGAKPNGGGPWGIRGEWRRTALESKGDFVTSAESIGARLEVDESLLLNERQLSLHRGDLIGDGDIRGSKLVRVTGGG